VHQYAVPAPTSEPAAIRAHELSKGYQIYDAPRDRLKQFLLPRLQRLFGMRPRQYYREFWALRNISFEVRKGETVGVIGRNGSGKSTLLQMICGTLHPNSGTVEVNGRVAALLELGSGFNPEFTGRENVFMNAGVMGLSPEQIAARFPDIVAFADIGEFIDQPVKTYSSGMAVRLAFAVIAHVDADILVIDEALAVGDAFFTQKCMRFLRTFMKTGTVLFVSHDTAAVKSLCSRVIWLEKGEVLRQGDPKEISDLYLEAFYEEKHGRRSSTKLKAIHNPDPPRAREDQRVQSIDAGKLRSELRVFSFDPDAASFGDGGARITAVDLLDKAGKRLNWVVGGEEITLRIRALANVALNEPIIGFYIKDRLGQTLFGDNTYLSHRHQATRCEQGGELQADFSFVMPILPRGDYSVNAAIASGNQEEHVQHHWIHDALMFKSESSSVNTGLIGIPMLSIRLQGSETVS